MLIRKKRFNWTHLKNMFYLPLSVGNQIKRKTTTTRTTKKELIDEYTEQVEHE